jgi:anti-sigma factor ChrR (cupin superfamily)
MPDQHVFHLSELLAAQGPPRWQPLRPGIEICHLYDHGPHGPSAAMLRYAPGAALAAHRHEGFEHIFVLEGEQEDQRGRYPAGSCVVNLPGSVHEVKSPRGCVVLVLWERPVNFLA